MHYDIGFGLGTFIGMSFTAVMGGATLFNWLLRRQDDGIGAIVKWD